MATETPSAVAENPNGRKPAPHRPRRAIKRSLTAEDWAQIEAMAGAGLPMAKIARAMDLSQRTLYKWRRLRASLDAAIEKGLAKTEAAIGKVLVDKAKAGDLGAIVWWEKTRAGRRDTTGVTSGGRPIGNIVYVIQNAAGELVDQTEAPELEAGPRPGSWPPATGSSARSDN
jgi:transposase-like protein